MKIRQTKSSVIYRQTDRHTGKIMGRSEGTIQRYRTIPENRLTSLHNENTIDGLTVVLNKLLSHFRLKFVIYSMEKLSFRNRKKYL